MRKKEFQEDYWNSIDKYRPYRRYDNPVIQYFVKPKIEFIKKHICLDKNTNILDVGCGFGIFTHYLEKLARTVGTDFSLSMLKDNPCKLLINSNGKKLPFKNNTFDVVFCGDLLHHVDDERIVLKEMLRVSKKDIIILEPNGLNPFVFLFSSLVKEERKGLRFSKSYIKKLIGSDGSIVTSRYVGWVFQNLMPLYLAKIMKYFEFGFFGAYTLVIAKKKLKNI